MMCRGFTCLLIIFVGFLVANASKSPATGPVSIFSASFTTSLTSQRESSSSSLTRYSFYQNWNSPPFVVNLTETCDFGGEVAWDLERDGAMLFADVSQLVVKGGYVAAACNWTTDATITLHGFGLVFIEVTNSSGESWPTPFQGPCISSQNTSCYPDFKVISAGPKCEVGETCPQQPLGAYTYSWDLSGPLPAAVTTPGAAAMIGLVMNTTGTSTYCSMGTPGSVISTLSCAITILAPSTPFLGEDIN
jgi:hypothetical protein